MPSWWGFAQILSFLLSDRERKNQDNLHEDKGTSLKANVVVFLCSVLHCNPAEAERADDGWWGGGPGKRSDRGTVSRTPQS